MNCSEDGTSITFSILLAVVFNGSGGSAFLAMLMHGTDNSTQGRVPIDVDLVLQGDVLNYEALVSLYLSHAAVTWIVAVAVLAVVGTSLYRRRARKRRYSKRRITAEN